MPTLPAKKLAAKDNWLRSAMRIRCALAPDDPTLIGDHFAQGRMLVHNGRMSDWEVAERDAELLIRTARDKLLPWHWRTLCLDHVHGPLSALRRLASCEATRNRVAEFQWRLATLDLGPPESRRDDF
ncbi:MAG: hypothetical protein ACK4KV_15290 [Rhodocyclaceae bacterium]